MARHAHRIDAIREWFFTTAPVGVYLLAEHDTLTVPVSSIAGSAEWGIATAFLSIAIVQVLLFDAGKLDSARWTLNRSIAMLIAAAGIVIGYLAIMVSMRILDARNVAAPAPMPDIAPLVARQWSYFVFASLIYLWVKARVSFCEAQRP
jgi:hypothetical protein